MWEMTSFLLECLHFPTPARVSATVKRVIVLLGLISVQADIRLQFIIVEEEDVWGQSRLSVKGCNIHILYMPLEVLIGTVGLREFTVSAGNWSDLHWTNLLLLCEMRSQE